MRWTKQRSLRAHAAKERLRLERAVADPEIPDGRCPIPRRPKPDFTIRIESKRGERIQVSAWRFYNRVIFSDGVKSVRQLCRGIEHLLTKSA